MKWSLKIGQVAGIGVYVHWTFFLLLAWIAYVPAAAGADGAAMVQNVGFVLALFACVVLHELGHALTAQRFGVTTRDITLLPIGGVARLERIPEERLQEFWVAVAGPAVNVIIAGLLFVTLHVLGDIARAGEFTIVGGSFLAKLLWVNVALVLFNMLPAFPMDGGRVLRSLLATRMSRVKATHIAASIGQLMAILFGMLGVFSGQWMLLFIAMFVYLGAQGESHAVEMRAMFKGVLVRDAMIKRFQTLTEDDPVEAAVRESSLGLQRDFPVTAGHEIRGILFHQDVVRTSAEGSAHVRVGDIMRRDCLLVEDHEPLDRALDKMQSRGCGMVLVQRGGELVGLLSPEHLGQWVMLHSSHGERPPGA